jgi:hypothetical protein
MYRNALQLGLAVCALVACAGCHGMCRVYQPSCHHFGWDPVLGSCDACGVCGGACEGHTPSSYTKHMLTCASGCGEIYWDEWLSDPPDACDPCDHCGNFVGPRPCPPTFWQSLTLGWCHLWGQRAVTCSDCVGDVVDYGLPAYGLPASEMPTHQIPESSTLEMPTLPPDTGAPAAGDDQLQSPDPVPDRQATLQSRPRPMWRARPISLRSQRGR